MSQSNETPQEVLLKVKKIKALAERGIGGEKEAARKLLAALCAKYGISEEEISEEKKYTYSFHVRTSVLKLFFYKCIVRCLEVLKDTKMNFIFISPKMEMILFVILLLSNT
jgi:hypothetical protein